MCPSTDPADTAAAFATEVLQKLLRHIAVEKANTQAMICQDIVRFMFPTRGRTER